VKRGLEVYARFVYAFLHLPPLVLAIFNFKSSKFTVGEVFSLHWYSAALADRDLIESAMNSLGAAFREEFL
jgi:ABC-type spermidine/putrescine transport system permease subunit II